jgi:hypothetical protein
VPETIRETEEQWCRAQRGERNERNGEMHKEMRSRDERWQWERGAVMAERETERERKKCAERWEVNFLSLNNWVGSEQYFPMHFLGNRKF